MTIYQQQYIQEIEQVRYILKRGYETHLSVNDNGRASHDTCINHCLLYAFGECNEAHTTICTDCSKLFQLFSNLYNEISSENHNILRENEEYLYFYLAHQARKTYLNSQLKANLLELDEQGAIIIADYKMRILPKTARETKEQFFGKHGWTLHTILIYTKSTDDNLLKLTAYDHWSTDTKQDAWFTASCFDIVFETIDPKPKWVRIISDNGPHYHCSELMTIILKWKEWYDIDVKGWIFLEPGEAKTTIDSHHAQVK
ncbi:MAG: hypothetical protein QOK71_03960 [Nitrososphaeraceae archaeon]|nr:hypothetical protein [Nitrososphaeraceae archaeon]